MLKLLRSETRENVRDHVPEELENETRSFYTPTKTVRNNSTQNEDHSIIRNTHQNVKRCFRSLIQLLQRNKLRTAHFGRKDVAFKKNAD